MFIFGAKFLISTASLNFLLALSPSRARTHTAVKVLSRSLNLLRECLFLMWSPQGLSWVLRRASPLCSFRRVSSDRSVSPRDVIYILIYILLTPSYWQRGCWPLSMLVWELAHHCEPDEPDEGNLPKRWNDYCEMRVFSTLNCLWNCRKPPHFYFLNIQLP